MPELPIPNANSAADGQAAAPPPLDVAALLERCLGNVTLVAMLFDKFETQARADLVRIERALLARDAGQASKVAHALKGAAGALSASGVQRSAAAIERAARESKLDAAAECLRDLKCEVDRCLTYLPDARAATKAAQTAPKT